MEGIIGFITQLSQAAIQAHERKWSFLGVFFVIFCGSTFTLAQYDFVPDAASLSGDPDITFTASPIAAIVTPAIPLAAEDPVKIEIAKIGLTASIANPTTTDDNTLDQYLLKGAVRYPTSAELGENGNVVLFGHSSYLPIVGNQAYKTFDGIQKLAASDEIVVMSSDIAYTYRVRSVEKESAASDAGIPLNVSGRVLTLVTCNSFATKTDRFIVTADFVESHLISST